MKQYNSLFTEYDSLPPNDQLTAREEAFKDCYEQNTKLSQAVNDKDQELFELQELVGDLLEALQACVLEMGSFEPEDDPYYIAMAKQAIRKAKENRTC